MGKPKIPLKHIPSDDCAVYVGRVVQDGQIVEQGEAYYPHQGEEVEVLPIGSLGEAMALGRFAAMSEGAVTAEMLLILDKSVDELCRGLAKRVISWTWTDMLGRKLPQPFEAPEIIKDLSPEEILWLRQAVNGETPSARKNVSGPLQSTSSTGARKPKRSS